MVASPRFVETTRVRSCLSSSPDLCGILPRRIDWYGTNTPSFSLALLAGFVFLIRLAVGAVRRVNKRGKRANAEPSIAWRLSGALSLLMIAAPFIAPLDLFTGRPPYYAPPWSIYVCLLALLAGAVLGVALLWFSWRSLSLSGASRPQRALVWSVGAASLLTTALLWNWNLLGVQS